MRESNINQEPEYEKLSAIVQNMASELDKHGYSKEEIYWAIYSSASIGLYMAEVNSIMK